MVSANWKEFKLKAGRMSMHERLFILNEVGKLAQEKYNELVMNNRWRYNLRKLKNFLKYEVDPNYIENYYYLQGPDQHWTDVANYFEYGTGMYNSPRATGKYQKGKKMIEPMLEQYMVFFWKKKGRWSKSKEIKGVHATFAMTKAIAYIKDTFRMDATNPLYRKIRWSYQNE